MIAQISGLVMSDTVKEFEGKKTRFLQLFQEGQEQLIKVVVPFDFKVEKGDIVQIDVTINPWNINGKTGVSVKLSK